MIAHLVCRTEAGLRYVDVWQTKNDFDAFEHGRLLPVVHPLLQDMLWTAPGILEALIPGRMQGHGGTEEVPG
jgi:hypothetical protein